MIYRIHFDYFNNKTRIFDSVDITADTIEKIREIADKEIKKRGGKNPWSEEIK